MSRQVRSAGVLASAIAAVAVVAFTGGGVAGQSAPRTPWGDPDLQGIWGVGYILTPLERPDKFAGREFLTDEEAAALEREQATNPGRNKRGSSGTVADVEGAYNDVFTGRGTRVVRTKRTSLIVEPSDGKIPPRTPEGEKRLAASRRVRDDEFGPGGKADDPDERRQERGTGTTRPVISGSAGVSAGCVRIAETKGPVALSCEAGQHGGACRTIPGDGSPHLPPHVRQWLGDARGRWEGDTLV